MKHFSAMIKPLGSAIVLGVSLSLLSLGIVRHSSIQMTHMQHSYCGAESGASADREIRIRFNDKWYIWAQCESARN